jgi:protein-S-isoprenylcysteine O-methyltransferase Ste14
VTGGEARRDDNDGRRRYAGAAGDPIWVLGLGLAVWARIYLGRNWGMPTSTKEDPELVTSGPYRTIRHPIYTGILLALIGSAVAVSVWGLIAVALIGGYFIYSAFVEERNMTSLLPGAIRSTGSPRKC